MRRIKVKNKDGKIIEKVGKIEVPGVVSMLVNNSGFFTTPGSWVEIWLRGVNIEEYLNKLSENGIDYSEEMVIPG